MPRAILSIFNVALAGTSEVHKYVLDSIQSLSARLGEVKPDKRQSFVAKILRVLTEQKKAKHDIARIASLIDDVGKPREVKLCLALLE